MTRTLCEALRFKREAAERGKTYATGERGECFGGVV